MIVRCVYDIVTYSAEAIYVDDSLVKTNKKEKSVCLKGQIKC